MRSTRIAAQWAAGLAVLAGTTAWAAAAQAAPAAPAASPPAFPRERGPASASPGVSAGTRPGDGQPGTGNGAPVILQWMGSGWQRVPSQEQIGISTLSARSAFAVGARVAKQPTNPLIMNWNGTSWKVVPS